jgi:hypothetical protein
MSANTLKKVADTILEEGIDIDFDVRSQGRWHSLLQWLRIKPKVVTKRLKPVTLGTLIKISKLLIDIDMSVFDMKNLLESNYQAIVKHGGAVAKIVAIAIDGRRADPPQDLVDMVIDNFTAKELQATTALIFGQMDIENFMLSIFSVKGGMQILEKSQVQEELIAPGPLSAVS